LENRLVLGIDNSMDFLSIVLSFEDRFVEERHVWNKRAPSEIVAVEVLNMLTNNGYAIDNVGLIAVTLGPGSFTGIRVALAFCKGLQAGGNIPLVGVPTLDALASPFSFMEGYYLCPVIDAKKSEVFACLYQVSEGQILRIDDYRTLKPADLVGMIRTPCLCFGTGAGVCAPFLSDINDVRVVKDGFSRISGDALVKEGLKRASEAGTGTPQPIYCRKSEAEIKFNINIQ
jgi:tRNA threonylcarbamoyladenosine biosynthesis protein TsaB